MTELTAEGAGADLPPAREIEGLAFRVVDLAHIVMISGESGDQAFAKALKKAVGLILPKPGEIAGSDPSLLWHGPGRWLLLGETESKTGGEDLVGVLSQEMAVSDVTDGYLVVELSGPRLHALLAMGTSLDLGQEAAASGRSAVTRFAELPALLLLLEHERARILVERASRAYVWAWLNRAADALRSSV